MDRKLIWKYLDKLVEKQNIGLLTYWPTTAKSVDCPFGWLGVYLELERRGLVVVYTDGEHESVQVYLTDEGLHVYRRMLAARIDRKHHALAYRIRRMRPYVNGKFLFDPHNWAQFQRRHALYLTDANERQAARNLAGMDMIRAVEVYEDNPMFDVLYKRWHAVVRRSNMCAEIRKTHGTLIRHLRDLKGSRLP